MRGNLPGPEGLARHFARAQPLYLAVPADLSAGAAAALHGLPVVPPRAAPRALHPLPCTDPMTWAKPNCIARIYGLANAAHVKYSDRLQGPGPDLAATFFGHPRGLATLFLTEMWERFTYYGMRALLVLFLVHEASSGGFGLDDRTAAAIYGLYTSSAYLAWLPGGGG